MRREATSKVVRIKELPGRLAIGLLYQLRHRALAGSVNGHKEKRLSFFGSDFGGSDMKIADGNRLSFCCLDLSQSMSGRCDIPRRYKQRYREDCVRCGSEGYKA